MTVQVPTPWYVEVLPLALWLLAFGVAYALGRSAAERGSHQRLHAWASPLVGAGVVLFLKHWLYDGIPWHRGLFGPVLLGCVAAGLMVGSRGVLGRRKRRGLCLRCGYNLTGNTSGVCPECGTSTGQRSI